MTIHPWLDSILQSAEFVNVEHRHFPEGSFLGTRHAHDDVYQICYMVNGTSRVLLGDKVWLMRVGDAILIPPPMPHGPAPDDRPAPTETLHLKFTLTPRVAWQPRGVIRVDVPLEFEAAFHRLRDEFNLRRPLREEILRAHLMQLTLILSRSARVRDPGRGARQLDWLKIRDERKVRTAMAWIAQHYREPVRLADMAAAAGINVSSLSAAFKSLTGVTPMRYLADYRLSQAAKLMWHGDDTLEAIAETVGFSSAHYMSRAFKKRFGYAPRQYAATFDRRQPSTGNRSTPTGDKKKAK